MTTLHYTKMSGAGNTFIMADGRGLPAEADLVALARECTSAELEHGGADGFIAVYPGTDGDDFEMRYYNRDGSTGMMCGNGGRCAVRYAANHGLIADAAHIRFHNAGVAYAAAITERGVKVTFPDPRSFELDRRLELFGASRRYHFADVGTPHAVLFVEDLDAADVWDLDLNVLGAAVRNHPAFQPDGANANFVGVRPDGSGLILRTFERGVEAETGACGTGAVSSAIIASMLYGLTAPVAVTTTSGATLWVDFAAAGGHVTDVSLEGGAEVVMKKEE